MKAVIVNSSELKKGCWLPIRFAVSGRCKRLDGKSKRPSDCPSDCKAIIAEVQYLRQKQEETVVECYDLVAKISRRIAEYAIND